MYGKRSIAVALLMLFAVEALAADVLLAREASSRAGEETAIKPAAITTWDQKPMGRAGVGAALTVTGLVIGGIGIGYKFGDPRPETPYTTVTLDVDAPPSQIAFSSFGRSEKTYNALNYLLMAGGGLLMVSGGVILMSSRASVSAQATPGDGSRLAVSVRF